MKMHSVLLCAVAAAALVAPAQASTLYGSTSSGFGELWILNPANGAGLTDVGPLNDALGNNFSVTGLAFDPLTSVLYGSTGGRTGTELLTINPATALVTVVGPYGAGAGNTMADLAFDSSGHLFGVSSAGGANLYSINTASGQATEVGPSGQSFTAGGGLAISAGGVFYTVPEHNNFGTFDPVTGLYTFIGTMATPGGAGTSYAALAFDGNTLYGMNLGTPTHLVTIDTATGNITDLGTSVPGIDAIAFTVVPEPSTAIMLAGALGIVAWRRRR